MIIPLSELYKDNKQILKSNDVKSMPSLIPSTFRNMGKLLLIFTIYRNS